MQRREFIAIGLSAFAVVRGARAQGRIVQIGYLALTENPALRNAFTEGMRELGYTEGRDYILVEKYYRGHAERLPELARELAAMKLPVIVAPATQMLMAMYKADAQTPIVATSVGDPVGLGVANSLARPGRNVTGVSTYGQEWFPKLYELILAIKPAPLRVGLVFDPTSQIHQSIRPRAVELATSLGLRPELFQCGSPDELNRLFAELGEARLDFVVFFTAPLFHVNRHRIAEKTRALNLPAVHGEREHAVAGDLLSFGINYAASWKRAAVFVDKILKGEKPGDIPIEQPPLLEVVLNLATARRLGIDIPSEILARADEVIE